MLLNLNPEFWKLTWWFWSRRYKAFIKAVIRCRVHLRDELLNELQCGLGFDLICFDNLDIGLNGGEVHLNSVQKALKIFQLLLSCIIRLLDISVLCVGGRLEGTVLGTVVSNHCRFGGKESLIVAGGDESEGADGRVAGRVREI